MKRVWPSTAILSASLLGVGPAPAQTTPEAPAYVGSAACASCHESVTRSWRGSDHQLAWTLPEDAGLAEAFDGRVFFHKGVETRFWREAGQFRVDTEGATGEMETFPVVGVGGIEPLQQLLLETEPGRLQALDIAWDVDRRKWYHFYPDQDLPPEDGLHWTGPYKNWNGRCAECHATGFEKNYDPRTRRYDSTEAEIGVGCEACHGPGETHIAWAEAPETHDAARWPGLNARGFTIGYSGSDAETEIQQCAGCHSRREPLGDGNPVPGTAFADAYRLSLLRDGLYHADGSIRDEVYVYGSFLQSKMYARGVRCSNCHDPHSTKLKATGNAVCTQCHSPAGKPRFPTLRKTLYDSPAHHFHTPGTPGAECKSCHMIERVYMGIDGRRDHSFRVPRPDLTPATGAPNACNDCHADRAPDWAAGEIATRFPDSTHRRTSHAQIIAAARRDPGSQADALLELARHEPTAAIVRATALDLLAPVATPEIAARAAALLDDVEPLVRAAAVAVQRAAPVTERVQRLVPLLSDRFRSVRIAAARGFLGAPIARMPPKIDAALKAAMDEWRASLRARADFPETHLVMGGMALVMRNPDAAVAAFREAVRLDPQRTDAWMMIVRIFAATGKEAEAREALRRALEANPDAPALNAIARQLQGGNK